jgi:hypothetical protein
MQGNDYLQALGPGVVFNVPDHSLGHFRDEYQHFLGVTAAPELLGNPALIEKAFFQFDATDRKFRAGSNQAVACATEPEGMIAMIQEVPAREAYKMFNPLDSVFTSQEQDVFWGGVSLGDLVLTSPPADLKNPDAPVLRSQVCVVIKTQGDDMYPVHFQSCYDFRLKRWWLFATERAVSPRMATSPPLVY